VPACLLGIPRSIVGRAQKKGPPAAQAHVLRVPLPPPLQLNTGKRKLRVVSHGTRGARAGRTQRTYWPHAAHVLAAPLSSSTCSSTCSAGVPRSAAETGTLQEARGPSRRLQQAPRRGNRRSVGRGRSVEARVVVRACTGASGGRRGGTCHPAPSRSPSSSRPRPSTDAESLARGGFVPRPKDACARRCIASEVHGQRHWPGVSQQPKHDDAALVRTLQEARGPSRRLQQAPRRQARQQTQRRARPQCRGKGLARQNAVKIKKDCVAVVDVTTKTFPFRFA
jgi:hypothetical protein